MVTIFHRRKPDFAFSTLRGGSRGLRDNLPLLLLSGRQKRTSHCSIWKSWAHSFWSAVCHFYCTSSFRPTTISKHSARHLNIRYHSQYYHTPSFFAVNQKVALLASYRISLSWFWRMWVCASLGDRECVAIEWKAERNFNPLETLDHACYCLMTISEPRRPSISALDYNCFPRLWLLEQTSSG